MAAIANRCYLFSSPNCKSRRPSTTKPSSFKPLLVKTKPISITLSSSSSSSHAISSPSSSHALVIAKPKPHIVETLIATLSNNPIIRTALIAAVTAAAAFFVRFSHRSVLAAPPPATVVFTDEEVSSLQDQMIAKKDDEEYEEAFEILEKLLEIQPEEIEWQIYKGQKLMYYGETESARLLFDEIIRRYPLRADVYNCLLMVYSESDAVVIGDIKDMVEAAMQSAEGENLRELKLIHASYLQRLENTKEALRVYDELITEDPQDFRVYLAKWGLHMILNEKVEAAKCLEKYKTLVPKDHPLKKQCDIYVRNFQKECDDFFELE